MSVVVYCSLSAHVREGILERWEMREWLARGYIPLSPFIFSLGRQLFRGQRAEGNPHKLIKLLRFYFYP
jgi:hypothetical protein